MILAHPAGYFITGTDTGVGKTYIACEVIRQLRVVGLTLEPRKPAESGCSSGPGGELLAADGLALQAANQHRDNIEHITPHRFKAALAPHRAARLEGAKLALDDLIRACSLEQEGHALIVEGAGGFYSPIAEDALNADLAAALQLPVIIVVNDRIGAVNQALMTIQAVQSRELDIAAIILNAVEHSTEAGMNNLEDLLAHCQLPVFCCAYNKPLEPVFVATGA